MHLPLTRAQLLRHIIAETARMAYPGSMSRGKKPVVSKGTKAMLEKHLVERFPIGEVWSSARNIAPRYEAWHRIRVEEIAGAIGQNVAPHNVPMSVAAKFLNTFMHQLIKYEEARPLLSALHLPLDARVFAKLIRVKSLALCQVSNLFRLSPYSLKYEAHLQIQQAFFGFIAELNTRQDVEFVIRSRIELNWLWI